MSDRTVHVRVPEDFLRRARQLIPYARRLPETVAIGRVTTAAICRIALARGLEALEEQLLPVELRAPTAQGPPKT